MDFMTILPAGRISDYANRDNVALNVGYYAERRGNEWCAIVMGKVRGEYQTPYRALKEACKIAHSIAADRISRGIRARAVQIHKGGYYA